MADKEKENVKGQQEGPELDDDVLEDVSGGAGTDEEASGNNNNNSAL